MKKRRMGKIKLQIGAGDRKQKTRKQDLSGPMVNTIDCRLTVQPSTSIWQSTKCKIHVTVLVFLPESGFMCCVNDFFKDETSSSQIDHVLQGAMIVAHRPCFDSVLSLPHPIYHTIPIFFLSILSTHQHAVILVPPLWIVHSSTLLFKEMNSSKSSEQRPALDLETRQAINSALTNQNTILQLTDSGLSAQRKRRQLKRGK